MKYLYGGIFNLKAEPSKLEGYKGECALWNKGKLAYFDTERQAREAQRKGGRSGHYLCRLVLASDGKTLTVDEEYTREQYGIRANGN